MKCEHARGHVALNMLIDPCTLPMLLKFQFEYQPNNLLTSPLSLVGSEPGAAWSCLELPGARPRAQPASRAPAVQATQTLAD